MACRFTWVLEQSAEPVCSVITSRHDEYAMYESHALAPLPRARFVRRLLTHASLAFALLVMSLLLGMIGYKHFEQLPWVDGFLNSAMLLGGMGPVNPPQSVAGKIFAGLYALYAGLVFIVTAALVLTPIVHRLMHHFHWDEDS